MIERQLKAAILKDLPQKIVILSGPRQCGKTSLSQNLGLDYQYFNFDDSDSRQRLLKKDWDRSKELIVFDELHKMKNWKSWLKGIYDIEKNKPPLLVTGSAKLNAFKKAGDSLAGRYFDFRLYPLDLKELSVANPDLNAQKTLEQLLEVSGFPEPFLKGRVDYYHRWERTHTDIILRQDLIDLSSLRDINGMQTLVQLLRSRVGSPVSYSSLARDLQISPATVKNWLETLENLYIVFKVTPYHHNIARSLLKEPKYYFYDTAKVLSSEGARFENLVALSLIKELHYLEDVKGNRCQLHYLRSKDKKEIDFMLQVGTNKTLLIEVKLSEDQLSSHFKVFESYFPKCKKIQLVKNLKKEKLFPDGSEIRLAANWLQTLSF